MIWKWSLKIALCCSTGIRKRSITELLFRMVQAGSK